MAMASATSRSRSPVWLRWQWAILFYSCSISVALFRLLSFRATVTERNERRWGVAMKRTAHRAIGIVLAASASLLALASSAAEQSFVPVTDAMLANPDASDWLMVSRTYDEHRYSPLNQITKANAAQLRMAWAR